jgi:hypothetical protein
MPCPPCSSTAPRVSIILTARALGCLKREKKKRKLNSKKEKTNLVGCLSYKLYRLFLSPHSLSVTTVTLGSRLFFYSAANKPTFWWMPYANTVDRVASPYVTCRLIGSLRTQLQCAMLRPRFSHLRMITLFKRQVSGWCFHCAKLLSFFYDPLDTSDVADPKSSSRLASLIHFILSVAL